MVVMIGSIELGDYLREKKIDTTLTALIESVARSAINVADHLKRAASTDGSDTTGESNELDDLRRLADREFSRNCGGSTSLAAIASKGAEDVAWLKSPSAGDFILYLAPFDGSPDTDIDFAGGSIFAVGQVMTDGVRDERRRGRDYLCAGYAIYGSSAMLVLTFGVAAMGFTLDPSDNRFKLSHTRIRIPSDTNELTIDRSRQDHWDEAIRCYVDGFLAGRSGPRGKDVIIRDAACFVQDAHRLLTRGGIFISPTYEHNCHANSARMMFDVNPLAFLIDAAGGFASTGLEDILRIQPQFFDRGVPILLGASDEIARIVELCRAHEVPEEIAS